MSLNIVILAAGFGKRMCSNLPKVLHSLAGKPLLTHVIDTASILSPQAIHVVVGHGKELIMDRFPDLAVNWVHQSEPLGTAHAVMQALPFLDGTHVMILLGDAPLLNPNTLQSLIDNTPANALGVVTAVLDDPSGLGRIVRDNDGNVLAILEDKDTSDIQKAIAEINTGIILCPIALLKKWLPDIKNNNQQSEYYLTEIVSFAVEENIPIYTIQTANQYEAKGVNDLQQLVFLEKQYQKIKAIEFLADGVRIMDPDRFDLRGNLIAGQDVVIDCNVIIEGNVEIGANSVVGANSYLKNVKIGEGVHIKSHSIIEDAVIDSHCNFGPLARIRPGTHLGEGAQVGNFVEVKKSSIGKGSKINHLSYIGDATVGSNVIIGAGTITCNYDGADKHPTYIGDNAFIGSDTQLVAPVTIGENATIGAGSTITSDAAPGLLTLSRSVQTSIENWERPIKRKK